MPASSSVVLFGFAPAVRVALILLLCGAFASRADEPIPEGLAKQNGLYRNYLSAILQSGKIKDAAEVRLLTKLNASEEINVSLLCRLGYFAKVRFRPFGSMQEPGKEPEQTVADSGYQHVQMSRMKLHDCFEDQRNKVRIYVFNAFGGWPGINDTCVVLTTLEDSVLDWRGHSQSDVLKTCNYDPAAQEASLVCKHRQGGERTYTYKIHFPDIELVP